MNKRKAIITSVLAALVILLLLPNIRPSATDAVDTWSEKKVTDTKKVWTIAFSKPLKATSIKDSTVYVEDENYRLFFTTATLSSDKKSIIVTPREPYQENVKYRLNISSEIVSEKGEKLGKGIIMPFVVNGSDSQDGQDGDAIRSVTFSTNAFATTVNVISNDTVVRVTANSKELHYLGNNTYSTGLTGISSGSTVKIQAYDMNGKRIFSKDYKVN